MRWRRRRILILTFGGVLLLGAIIRYLPGEWSLTLAEKGAVSMADEGGAAFSSPPLTNEPDRQRWREALQRPDTLGVQTGQRVLFEHGVALMQQGHLGQAAQAFETLLQSALIPEAFVNLGFVRYDQQRFDEAKASFNRAIDLNPAQGNGYYGLAIAEEALGDLKAALGAMRAFLHVADGHSAYKARARAALWEWEARLGRLDDAGERRAALAVDGKTKGEL